MNRFYMHANPNPDDDIDFGIDVSTLSEADKALYEKLNKQMRGAYLKKTDELAKTRKEQQSAMEKLQAEHAEATKALTEWQTWYQREGQYMTPRQQQQAMAEEGLENPNTLMQEIQTLRGEFAQAAKQYNEVISKLQSDNASMQQAFTLYDQLTDLRMKHPEMDKQRVISTAKERGIRDMELAYQLTYGDELRQKSVEEEVTRRVDEERQKMQAEKEIVDTKPSTTRYAPAPEAKSYSDAGVNLLGTLRKSGTPTTLTD